MREDRGIAMRIAGLQKLTLLDYPGQVACTVFTGGCNFRCPYCHNASLVLPERMGGETEDVLRFLEKRRGVLEGVAVSGGEPLMQPDIADFLRAVRTMGYKIKLDTNGSLPDRLCAVVEAGLVDCVAMDIKNAPERYAETAGVAALDLAAVARSKDYLLSGAVDCEFRTTLVRGLHTPESVRGAAAWIAGARAYYLQQYRDSGDVIAPEGLEAFSDDEMRAMADIARAYVPSAQVRGVE